MTSLAPNRSLKNINFRVVKKHKKKPSDNVSKELLIIGKDFHPWSSIYTKEISQPILNYRSKLRARNRTEGIFSQSTKQLPRPQLSKRRSKAQRQYFFLLTEGVFKASVIFYQRIIMTHKIYLIL